MYPNELLKTGLGGRWEGISIVESWHWPALTGLGDKRQRHLAVRQCTCSMVGGKPMWGGVVGGEGEEGRLLLQLGREAANEWAMVDDMET